MPTNKSSTAKKPRSRSPALRAYAPKCSRNHPRLTNNRHLNEHLTFCALHERAASDSKATRAQKAAHRRAFEVHASQALKHMRVM